MILLMALHKDLLTFNYNQAKQGKGVFLSKKKHVNKYSPPPNQKGQKVGHTKYDEN